MKLLDVPTTPFSFLSIIMFWLYVHPPWLRDLHSLFFWEKKSAGTQKGEIINNLGTWLPVSELYNQSMRRPSSVNTVNTELTENSLYLEAVSFYLFFFLSFKKVPEGRTTHSTRKKVWRSGVSSRLPPPLPPYLFTRPFARHCVCSSLLACSSTEVACSAAPADGLVITQRWQTCKWFPHTTVTKIPAHTVSHAHSDANLTQHYRFPLSGALVCRKPKSTTQDSFC